jgi:hypothetical protein
MPRAKQPPRVRLAPARAQPRAAAGPQFGLLVVDHARLQGEAWAEFHTARKQLDRAARELHRHEGIDVPAFSAWLHRTFPVQVTTLRELRDEVNAKAAQVRRVQVIAATSGGSLKRVWREQKESAGKPRGAGRKFRSEREAEFDDSEHGGPRHDARREDFAPGPAATRTDATRNIYRRLVQRLHPDRGGDWTLARQRLWHEVQQAWAAGDGDWLARLEVEWETAHEAVGPQSALSRLRAAIAEVHAARRDTEAKLSDYRFSPQWRFTLAASRRAALERRVEADFVREGKALQRDLRYLNATIAAWEEDWTKADARANPRRSRHAHHHRGRGG